MSLDLARPESWPVLLTLPELLLIVRRAEGGVRKELQARTFVPAPFATRPYRWRREDVERWLRGADALHSRKRVA
jgi:hypothetical protein